VARFLRHNKNATNLNISVSRNSAVRQYILGVVDNVIHCFVENLTGFSVVKEFWKSVTIWRNHRHNIVLGTPYILHSRVYDTRTRCSAIAYRDRAAGCSSFGQKWKTELVDNILRTL